MRHGRLRRKLGVKTKHRKALLRNLVKHLVVRKRIQTTLAKAKEASSFADKMVTIAKQGTLHARRLLISELGCSRAAHTMLTQIAPEFKERQGGYTRVLRLGTRAGDGAQVALLEFTAPFVLPEKTKKPKKQKKAEEPTAKEEKVVEKPKKEKAHKREEKADEPKISKKKASSSDESADDQGETKKKGGFLGALRKFLKGDEQ